MNLHEKKRKTFVMSGFIHKVLKSGLGIFTSRIFGLIRDIAVAGYFGASGLTDAFFSLHSLFPTFSELFSLRVHSLLPLSLFSVTI